MAARPDSTQAEIADLRQTKGFELAPLLDEERETWRRTLHWDFTPSADLIRRYVDMRALTGFVLRLDRRAFGYAYHVIEESKALLGNLFVMPPLATPEAEHRLLDATLEDAFSHSAVRRVEAQLMMLRHPPEHGRFARRFAGIQGQNFLRHFMMAELQPRPGGKLPRAVQVEAWEERHTAAAAQLIMAAYDGHIDSQINDQYLSETGARRFLSNIVLYPGCGAFCGSASFASTDAATGALTGLSLSSIVAPETGHITQICVAPWAQGQGIGAALLSRSLDELFRAGCRRASLTVTAANTSAIRLYERFGFGVLRNFSAHVWQER